MRYISLGGAGNYIAVFSRFSRLATRHLRMDYNFVSVAEPSSVQNSFAVMMTMITPSFQISRVFLHNFLLVARSQRRKYSSTSNEVKGSRIVSPNNL